MDMSRVIPRSFCHFRLRCCDRCFKANSKFQCAGCQAVVYCGRECQKAAWREHKPICASQPNTDLNLQASLLGYPSSLSLLNALSEWIEIRRWCLYTLMCALVQLEGGVDAVLEGVVNPVLEGGVNPVRTSQKALMLHVVAAKRTEHDGNPAFAFRLGHASIADKDSEDFLRANWKDVEHDAKFASTPVIVLTKLLDTEQRDDMATPAGILPVVYIVHGTDIVSLQAFTLYHLPLRYVDGNLKDVADARTRVACEELVEIVKDLLHKPFVYRRAENRQRPEPDWGIYERAGTQMKRWRWRQLPADRKSWRVWERLTDEMFPGRTSRLTPRQVLTLFDFGQLLGIK